MELCSKVILDEHTRLKGNVCYNNVSPCDNLCPVGVNISYLMCVYLLIFNKLSSFCAFYL